MTHSDRRVMRRIALFILSVAASLLPLSSPGIASAHALFERSTPVPDSVVPISPAQVHIWFSEDLSSASKILVWDRYRHNRSAGNAVIVPGQSKQLEIGLSHLQPGSYLVLWTSVSADDGHILHGSFVFSVKHRGPLPSLAGVSLSSGQQTFPDAATLTALLAHWIELLSSVVWVGAVAFPFFVLAAVSSRIDARLLRVELRRRNFLIAASLVFLLASSCVVIGTQSYALAGNDWGKLFSEAPWSAEFSANYGRLWICRQVLVLLTLMAFLFHLRVSHDRLESRSDRDTATGLLLISGVVYLYLFAASGHAASAAIGTVRGENVVSVSVVADWLHFVSDALWFGGQIYLVVALVPALELRRRIGPIVTFLDALSHFSPVAYLSVALYVVSGLFSAKVHVPSWYAFFNSIYGRTLIVKILLIGLMMITSSLAVYVIRPLIRRGLNKGVASTDARFVSTVRSLLRWLRVNPVLGAGVLLATSVMFYYPVPFGFAPPPPAGYTLSSSGLTGRLTVTPAHAGSNQMTILLRQRNGKPLKQAGVRVLTTMLDMTMGTGVAVLDPTSKAGVFSGTVELGMGGHWGLLFLVYLPNGSFIRLPVKIRVST